MNKNKISTVRGMHDIYGEDHYKQQKVIDNFIKVVSLFNFTPINTPIMEHSEVFLRTLGNTSDVVMKEMYSFLDKSKESLTLRPEGTAGIARALVSNGLILTAVTFPNLLQVSKISGSIFLPLALFLGRQKSSNSKIQTSASLLKEAWISSSLVAPTNNHDLLKCKGLNMY